MKYWHVERLILLTERHWLQALTANSLHNTVADCSCPSDWPVACDGGDALATPGGTGALKYMRQILIKSAQSVGMCMTVKGLCFLYQPTSQQRTSWLVNPLDMRWYWIFAAILPALLATILIFMDQQITAVIVNRKENKLLVSVWAAAAVW